MTTDPSTIEINAPAGDVYRQLSAQRQRTLVARFGHS